MNLKKLIFFLMTIMFLLTGCTGQLKSTVKQKEEQTKEEIYSETIVN